MNKLVFAWTVLGVLALAASDEPSRETPPPVTVDVFSDFQCPYCGQFAKPVRELESKGVEGLPTKVVFHNFPLSFHPFAQLAHQAALAAGQQGKFWEMHDLLFANQSALQREKLLEYAQKLGLDMDRFRRDLDSDAVKKIIEHDKAEGALRSVTGTPTFFVNGKSYSGTKSYEQLKQLVQGEQKRMWSLTEITDQQMSKGPSDAPVTLEFFADLESPVTRPANAVVADLMARYPDQVRLQFRNFPLAFHPLAGLAHEAAMDAARQGRFWEFESYILEHQDSLREQDLVAYAGQLGLDEKKFAETIQQRRYSGRVDADLEDGAKRGLRGSPVIFVNKRRIDGVPSMAMLTEYVEAELAASRLALK